MFKQLDNLFTEGTTLNINITKKEGAMLVAVAFNSSDGNKAVDDMPPALLKGSAEELDEGFINAITKPAKEITGLITNAQWLEKQLEEKKKEQEKKKNKATGKKTTTTPKTSTPVKEEEKKEEEPETSKDQLSLL